MDRSYVSGVERGEFNISLLALTKLARALDVRLASLVENE
jgi:transcriptional regulator with XRE-family HTH domain